jgi:predicted Zn finger-like uncharacterized protein
MQVVCPQCGKNFNVLDNQLEITNGSVDCPKCEHVFNAYSGLNISTIGTLKDSYNKTPFVVLSVILFILLLLQLLYFDSQKVSKMLNIKEPIYTICKFINCPKKLQKDIRAIKIIKRSINNHPTKEKALIIKMTIKNTAIFAQPFASMVLGMSNIQGETIAQRVFKPADYISSDMIDKKMQPNGSYSLELAIKDPGTNALNFAIDFIDSE